MPHVGRNFVQRVERYRIFNVARIEIDDILDSLFRDMREKRLHQITMRIDDTDAIALFDVRDSHIGDQARLSCSGLPDDIHVPAPVFLPDAEELSDVPPVGDGDGGDLFLVIVGSIHF